MAKKLLRQSTWFTALFVAVFACGCGSMRSGQQRPVDALQLLGTPVAMNLDNKPGADGMGVRVYAMNRAANETVRVSAGALEIILFDGNVRASEVATTAPLRVWSYSAHELRRHEQKSAIGFSYAFVPVWTETPPKRNRVTVVARYTNAPSTLIYSAPVSVPLAGR
jgi:hypothetical protein